MFTRLKDTAGAAILSARAAAAATIDVAALTGRAKGAADAARNIAAHNAQRLRNRAINPSTAYDAALEDMLSLARTMPSIDDEDLKALTSGAAVLADSNPYKAD